MQLANRALLLSLGNPLSLKSRTLDEWEEILSEARCARLLPRLAALVYENEIEPYVPAVVRPHVQSGRAIAAQHARIVRWELSRIEAALRDTGVPVILLKGAAYLAAGLPPARGRLMSDVDILVPRERLGEVEAALRSHGYQDLDLDPYDQRYYRDWMHEIPPLCHPGRTCAVDVHHNILPLTGRLHPEAGLLLSAVRTITGSTFKVLAPADMVLHSSVHLFQDGNLSGGLRDLIDLDDLMRYFGSTQGFWRELVPRAVALNVARPLYYTLRYTSCILRTPIPEDVMKAAAAARPPRPILILMDTLVERALTIPVNDLPPRLAKLANGWLYVRSHWLRMPPLLLAQHLTRKALRRLLEWWNLRREEQDVQHAGGQ